MVSHKAIFNISKKIEINFSKHNGLKPEINYKKIGRFTNTWRLNNMILNNQLVFFFPNWSLRQNQNRSQKPSWNKLKWKYNIPKLMGSSKSSLKSEVCINKHLHWQTRKISNKQSNSTLPGTRKRRTKPKVSSKKEITEIRAEINEMET